MREKGIERVERDRRWEREGGKGEGLVRYRHAHVKDLTAAEKALSWQNSSRNCPTVSSVFNPLTLGTVVTQKATSPAR